MVMFFLIFFVIGKETSVIVDVGGFSGQVMQLLSEHLPTLTCINFDLPAVIEKVNPIANIKMVAGDMFKVETLPKCDIIFTKYILHDWSDDKCIEFLQNFHKVLPDDGLFMSVSCQLPETAEERFRWPFGKDMIMLLLFGQARERTLTEYRYLFEKSGFKLKKTVMIGKEEIPYVLMIASKSSLHKK